MTPALLMTKARTQLVMSHPFFGTLSLNLTLIEDPRVVVHGMPTMGTDGRVIRYHPEFVRKLCPNEKEVRKLTAVIAHEVLHCAFLHQSRRQHRDPNGWNVAGDFAINQILDDSNMFTLPDDALRNPDYKGMTAEEIYAQLPKLYLPGPHGGSGKGPPASTGYFEDAAKEPNQDQQQANRQHEAEWRQNVAQAAHEARRQGKMPADLDRMVEDILEPVVPWKEVLRRFATETERGDLTWSKPNRRFIDSGLYLPSYEETDPKMLDVVVVTDSSGSISNTELQEFTAEINAIHQDMKPRRTIVICCDAEIQGEPQEFSEDDEVVLRLQGGGGTSFIPPFEWLEDQGITPKCLIYLTDGYGSFPDEPHYPVMWAMVTDVDPPFGEVVRLRT